MRVATIRIATKQSGKGTLMSEERQSALSMPCVITGVMSVACSVRDVPGSLGQIKACVAWQKFAIRVPTPARPAALAGTEEDSVSAGRLPGGSR